ncbi:hypothetical protein FQN50_005208 [Emmonsiellopsis sp. PD_5]|nr:hypothetical protein FQN50_005208 [Emmonsiellopsis sp. PD_5]
MELIPQSSKRLKMAAVLKAMRTFANIAVHHLSRNKSHLTSYLLFQHLPLEILLEICSFLPPSSQACFALVNRYFYSKLHHKLRLPQLHFPTEQPPGYYMNRHLSLSRFYQFERWELLRYLEQDQPNTWRECPQCFKLHPTDYFLPSSYLRPARPLCKYKYCAGLVDLCPCKKISIQDRQRILYQLIDETTRSKALRWNATAVTTHLTPASGRRYLSHKCSTKYDSAQLDIEIYLFHDHGRLYAQTKYRVCYFSHNSTNNPTDEEASNKNPNPSTKTPPPSLPRLACPHHLLSDWLTTMTSCRQYHPTFEFCGRCRRLRCCDLCNTVFGGLEPLPPSPLYHDMKLQAWAFWTLRDLDHTSTCHLPGAPACSWRQQVIFPAFGEVDGGVGARLSGSASAPGSRSGSAMGMTMMAEAHHYVKVSEGFGYGYGYGYGSGYGGFYEGHGAAAGHRTYSSTLAKPRGLRRVIESLEAVPVGVTVLDDALGFGGRGR